MINIKNILSNLGVVSGDLGAENKYEFYDGIEWSDGSFTYNEYEFYEKIGMSKYEFFTTYADTEYDFYKEIDTPGVYNEYTFFENGGQFFNLLPIADFTVNQDYNRINDTFSFTNTSSNADTYSWDFGDTNTSNLENPTHSYITTGDYIVELTASDGGLDPATHSETLNVYDYNIDFTSSNSQLQVTFTNTTTSDNITIDSYEWDFGDGNTSTQVNPVHTYATDGTYTVNLITYFTINGNTISDGVSKSITVTNVPDVTGLVITGGGVNQLTIDFDSDTTGLTTGYDVEYRPLGGSYTLVSDTKTLTGLSDATTYEIRVRWKINTDLGDWSTPVKGSTDESPTATEFIFKVDTTLALITNQFGIVTQNSTDSYTVDWGDGTVETGVLGGKTHTYSTGGEYIIQISGTFPGLRYFNNDNVECITEIMNWGDVPLKSLQFAFSGAQNLTLISAQDVPVLTNVTNMNRVFRLCAFVDVPNLGSWDTSGITDFSEAFSFNTNLNGPNLSNLDTSAATNMDAMFNVCNSFNQDLSGWCVSNIPSEPTAFSEASLTSANKPLWGLCPPYTVSGLVSTSQTSDSITIDFTNEPDLTTYDVGYTPAGGSETIVSVSSGPPHTITGLSDDTSYDIRVRWTYNTTDFAWSTPITVSTPAAVLIDTTDLISYYKFDNGGGVDSWGNNDLNYNNSGPAQVSDGPDRFDNLAIGGINWTSNGAYQDVRPVSSGSSDFGNMTLPLSVSLWIQPLSGPEYSIFNLGGDINGTTGPTNNRIGIQFQFDGSSFQIYTGNLNGFSVKTLSEPMGSGWIHFCIVMENSSTLKLYKNGTEQSLTGGLSNPAFYNRFSLGDLTRGWTNYPQEGDKYFDETSIWNRALTPSEVSTLANATGPLL